MYLICQVRGGMFTVKLGLQTFSGKGHNFKGRCSQHFIFFISYKWIKKVQCDIVLGRKGLPWMNTS